jgi:PadR family transcriptional regulator
MRARFLDSPGYPSRRRYILFGTGEKDFARRMEPICCISVYGIGADVLISKELKKGSTDFMILSLLEDGPRHGYEIGKLIETRSEGVLKLHAASLYPILYRLESKRLVQGAWERKAGGRKRRFYRLTAAGRKLLSRERGSWRAFVAAIDKVARVRHAEIADLD